MPMMRSPYDQVLSGTHGHCIHVTADKPIWIPPVVVSQALAGRMSEVDDQPSEIAAPAKTEDNEAVFAVELDQAILRILTRNEPTLRS